MLFPLIVLFYFLLLSILYTGSRSFDRDIRVRSFIFLFSLILLEVLRVYCQQFFTDIPEYRDIFRDMLPLYKCTSSSYSLEYYNEGTIVPVEKGFLLFVSLFKCFSNDFGLFLSLISIIELSCFYFFCSKMKVSMYLSLPIYLSLTYLTFQIGMLRQALAFCILLFALINISNKYKYFTLIVLGVFIHKSFAFCSLFYFAKRRFSPKVITYCFVFSLIVYLLKIEFIQYLWTIIGLEDLNRVDHYFESDIVNSYLGVGFWERVLLFCFMITAYKYLYKRNLLNKEYILLFNLGVFVILLQLVFFSSPVITSRLRYYIVIFPILFLALFIRNEIKNVQDRLVLQIPIYSYLVMYLFTLGTYITHPQ